MLKKAQCHKEYHFYCCFKEMIQSVLPDHMHLGKMRWVSSEISVSRSLQENRSRSLTLVLLCVCFFLLLLFVFSVYWNFVVVLVFVFPKCGFRFVSLANKMFLKFCADPIFALLGEGGGCRRLLHGEDLLSILDASISLKFFTALLVLSITFLVDKDTACPTVFFVRQSWFFS